MAEPRKFPYTSPNASAGEAAMIANIHGPTMAVGGRGIMSDEANQLAHDIVQSQWSNHALVVKVHEQSEAGDAWLQALQQPIRPSWFELWFYQIASLVSCGLPTYYPICDSRGDNFTSLFVHKILPLF